MSDKQMDKKVGNLHFWDSLPGPTRTVEVSSRHADNAMGTIAWYKAPLDRYVFYPDDRRLFTSDDLRQIAEVVEELDREFEQEESQ